MNSPRFLTEEEIKSIVDIIPPVKAISEKASKVATDQIKAKLAIQLSEYKICPNKIEKLKGYIINMYYRSLLTPGEPVGITAGEGIGGPTTQMTLSGFHQTGSKNVSSGVDIIRELLNITQIRKAESITLHFKDKNLSNDDIVEISRTLVGVTLLDLVKKHSIEDKASEDWWYKYYPTFLNGKIEDNTHLRLTIDKYKMYKHKLTLLDIVKILHNDDAILCVPSPSSLNYIDIYVNSKIKEIHEMKITNKSGLINIPLNFLLRTFIPNMKKFDISGVSGIKQIYPEKPIRTLSIFRTVKYKPRNEKIKADNMWEMWVNSVYHKIDGIPLYKARDLFNILNIKILEQPNNLDEDVDTIFPPIKNEINIKPLKFLVEMPPGFIKKNGDLYTPDEIKEICFENNKLKNISTFENKFFDYSSNVLSKEELIKRFYTRRNEPRDWSSFDRLYFVKNKPTNPQEYSNVLLDEEIEAENNYIKKETEKGKIFPIPQRSELSKVGNYFYASTDGSNLGGLFANSLIDKKRTISNNPNEIQKLIGIEAARNFIIQDFYQTIIDHNAYVSPRHVVLIGDFMTNQMLMSITSKGISRQNRGAFSDASFEHAIEAFSKSAARGKYENVLATSTCIFTGNRCGFGTGIMKLNVNTEILNEINKTKEKVPEIVELNDENLVIINDPKLQFDTNGDNILNRIDVADALASPIPPDVKINDTNIQEEREKYDVVPKLKSVSFKGPIPQITLSAYLISDKISDILYNIS